MTIRSRKFLKCIQFHVKLLTTSWRSFPQIQNESEFRQYLLVSLVYVLPFPNGATVIVDNSGRINKAPSNRASLVRLVTLGRKLPIRGLLIVYYLAIKSVHFCVSISTETRQLLTWLAIQLLCVCVIWALRHKFNSLTQNTLLLSIYHMWRAFWILNPLFSRQQLPYNALTV